MSPRTSNSLFQIKWIRTVFEHLRIVVTLDNNRIKYVGKMPCGYTGMVGYTVRVMPCNPLLAEPLSMGMIRWA